MNLIKQIFGAIWGIWSLVLFVLTFLIIMIPVSVIYFIPEPRRSPIFIKAARVWMAVYMPLIGCPVTITGKKHFKKGENYIVVCNHNSMMDVPVSCPGIPGGNKTIAKIEMARVPLFGIFYKLGSVLVDRKSEQSRRDSYNKMKQVLQMGLHMSIYPEGTRNTSNEPLKPFHDGAFKLAMDTGKPILPAIIFHTRKILPATKSISVIPHPIRMDFLPPIYIAAHHTTETLKKEVFDIMKAHYLAHEKK